jgi:outer membrane protein TolC
MSETIFDGGRRRATSEGALANYDATVATYRQTTLVAFQKVEDNLAALRILEHEAGQQKEAVIEAKRSVEIFTNRYELGADPTFRLSPLRLSSWKTSGMISTDCDAAWTRAFS